MIGRLETTVLDCPDPRALAAFCGELLGMRISEDTDGAWVVIGREPTPSRSTWTPSAVALRAPTAARGRPRHR